MMFPKFYYDRGADRDKRWQYGLGPWWYWMSSPIKCVYMALQQFFGQF